jgi:hypothetical protein
VGRERGHQRKVTGMAMPTFGDAAGGENESDEAERCRQSRGSRLEARTIPLTRRRRARKSASRQKFMKHTCTDGGRRSHVDKMQ